MTPERPKDPPRPDGHVRPDHDLGDIPESRVLFNTAMEMHDAKLESLTRATGDGEVVLVFSAYLHVSTGSPGIDAGGVTSERMELRIRDGRVEGEILAAKDLLKAGAKREELYARFLHPALAKAGAAPAAAAQ